MVMLIFKQSQEKQEQKEAEDRKFFTHNPEEETNQDDTDKKWNLYKKNMLTLLTK